MNCGRWPIAVVKSGSVPVSYGLSCALPFVVGYDAVCERSDESCRAATVFHIDGNDFKICWEVKAVKHFKICFRLKNRIEMRGLNILRNRPQGGQLLLKVRFKSNGHVFATNLCTSYFGGSGLMVSALVSR